MPRGILILLTQTFPSSIVLSSMCPQLLFILVLVTVDERTFHSVSLVLIPFLSGYLHPPRQPVQLLWALPGPCIDSISLPKPVVRYIRGGN